MSTVKHAPATLGLLLLVLLLSVSALTATHVRLVSSAEATENTWTSRAPMQQARGGLGVAAVNIKIYAIGGFIEGGLYGPNFGHDRYVGTNEEYAPETDMWNFKASMPTPRAYFAITVYQNKIYCIGGRTVEGVTGVNEVYDPATDTWETKTAMPTARWRLTANVVNGRIYLVGGSPNSTLNEVYDPENDAWVTETAMPTGASDYASAVVDNRIHFMGGDYSTLHQIYDTENDSWSMGTSIPERVYQGAAAATVSMLAPMRIYVVGFRKLDGEGVNYVYDPENDSWAVGAGVLTSRFAMGVAVVNDALYAVGGYIEYALWNVAPVAVNEQYIPFGYGTVPPAVSIVSPELNVTYSAGDVSLNFAVNKPDTELSYSLDGEANVTITGNTTLTGLSSGLHNVTVYARDANGNTGISETITFTVAEPFPVTMVVALMSTAAVIGISLAVYYNKTKARRTSQKPKT